MDMEMECNSKMTKKRPNLNRNVDCSILDRFWDLVDVSDEKRSKAAEQLLTALLLKQPLVKFVYL